MRPFLTFGIYAIFCFSLSAQVLRQTGRLITEEATDRLVIELYDSPTHQLVERVHLNPDGAFEFSSVVVGRNYELRVVTMHGDSVYTEHITPRDQQSIDIRLPSSSRSGSAQPAGPVSARRLAHKPPKKARKLFVQGEKLAAKNHLPESIAKLEEAVAEDPGYFEAWNNLGTRHIVSGQYQQAAAALAKAVQIDENASPVRANLALALLHSNRLPQAEQEARIALRLDPNSVKGSYILGLILAQQAARRQEALALLLDVTDDIPGARVPAAALYIEMQKLPEAAEQLKAYLSTNATFRRDMAVKMLTEVEKYLQTHAR